MDTFSREQRHKVIGVPLAKGMSKADDGSLLVKGYFTSDNKDEIGDIITRSATERAIPKYRQWGNIRYMHMPRPVAKVVRMGTEDGLDWNEVEIKVIDPQTVFEVENGLLAALSVGILINVEDIQMLEDGGWLINDYQLAEISLVDHPANYDARLKDLPVDQGLRMLARQYGFDAVAKGMHELLNREIDMEKEMEQPVEEEIEQPAAEEEIIEETLPVEEERAIEGEQPAAEEEIEQPAAEQEVEQPAEEQPAEEEEIVIPEEIAFSYGESLEQISLSLANLTELVLSLQAKLSETPAEALLAEERVESAETVVVENAISEQPAEDVVTGPANRMGGLPETSLPASDEERKELPTNNLRSSLDNYFKSRLK